MQHMECRAGISALCALMAKRIDFQIFTAGLAPRFVLVVLEWLGSGPLGLIGCLLMIFPELFSIAPAHSISPK